jgi:hypothetical protein
MMLIILILECLLYRGGYGSHSDIGIRRYLAGALDIQHIECSHLTLEWHNPTAIISMSPN